MIQTNILTAAVAIFAAIPATTILDFVSQSENNIVLSAIVGTYVERQTESKVNVLVGAFVLSTTNRPFVMTIATDSCDKQRGVITMEATNEQVRVFKWSEHGNRLSDKAGSYLCAIHNKQITPGTIPNINRMI